MTSTFDTTAVNLANDSSATVTVSNLPAHMYYVVSLSLEFSSSEMQAGAEAEKGTVPLFDIIAI